MPRKRKDDSWAAVPLSEATLPNYSLGAEPGAFDYELPPGLKVQCISEHERDLVRITARPYEEKQDIIPAEDWIVVSNYLQNVVMADRIRRNIGNQDFRKLPPAVQREQRSLLASLDDELSKFAVKRIDPLRASRGDDNKTMADVRADWEREALEYAEAHLGEHQWLACCPSLACEFHLRPFLVAGERAHWATDPAAGNGVIWNEEIACLVHLHYCTITGCEHKAHDMKFEGSLSVMDAAKVLRISAIGLIACAYERSFDLGVDADLDQPDSLVPYLN